MYELKRGEEKFRIHTCNMYLFPGVLPHAPVFYGTKNAMLASALLVQLRFWTSLDRSYLGGHDWGWIGGMAGLESVRIEGMSLLRQSFGLL